MNTSSGVARGGGRGAASIGAQPQTPGRLHRKKVAGSSVPRHPLGLSPRPQWGLPPPEPLLNVFWGGAPTGSGAEPHRGSGAEPPATFLRRSRPGLGQSPNSLRKMIQLSQLVWSTARSQICLNCGNLIVQRIENTKNSLISMCSVQYMDGKLRVWRVF